jgi:hypothetical protein
MEAEMDDPVIVELRKNLQELQGNVQDLEAVIERLARNPEVRTLVGRAFQSLTPKRLALAARFGPVTDSRHLPAILKVFRDRPGEWITIPEIAKVTKKPRNTLREVMRSNQHRDLFEHRWEGPHRLLWRLKEQAPAGGGPAPGGNGTPTEQANSKRMETAKARKDAGRPRPAVDKGDQQKAGRPTGGSSLKFAVDPKTGDVKQID